MLEKIKKHSVKIFVFTINILLATIAVLIIREKDQARLLENSQPGNPANENTVGNALPSFENSVSADSNTDSTDTLPSPVDNPASVPVNPMTANPVPKNSPPSTTSNVAPKKNSKSSATPASVPAVSAPASIPNPAVATPAPSQSTNSSNAKTKTS